MSTIPQRLAAALNQRYLLEREIGAGGMATVYLARDLRHKRSVALKVVRPELTGREGGERFLREIELAARLQHPHIPSGLRFRRGGRRPRSAGPLLCDAPIPSSRDG